jgi:hypothetical protein
MREAKGKIKINNLYSPNPFYERWNAIRLAAERGFATF